MASSSAKDTPISKSSAHCSASNCSNRQCRRPDLSFFKFPKNSERCQQWVRNSGRKDLLNRTPLYISSNCRLCAEHFELHQFSNKQTKNRLNWNAVPTIFSIPNARIPKAPRSVTPRRSLRRKAVTPQSVSDDTKRQRVTVELDTHSLGHDHAYCSSTNPSSEYEADTSWQPPNAEGQDTPNRGNSRSQQITADHSRPDIPNGGHTRSQQITADHSRPDTPSGGHTRSQQIAGDHSRPDTSTGGHTRSQQIARDQRRALKKERQRTFRLKKRVEILKQSMEKIAKKSTRKKDLIKQAGEYLHGPALSFFAAQLRNASRRRQARVRNWSCSDKVVALSLYHQSPDAYQFCQRIFALPSVASLRKWLSTIEVEPGYSSQIFDLLRDKVSRMSERDKYCVVSFDEMSIHSCLSHDSEDPVEGSEDPVEGSEDSVEGSEDYGSLGKTSKPADHALVFMVHGLLGEWKQPVGYFLSSDAAEANKLEPLLMDCIGNLKNVGLQPKVVVCDQESNNVELFSSLGVTENDPYFIHEGSRIYCLHDPPHLLKNTRSNLEKYVFEGQKEDGSTKQIQWVYLRNFYEHDSKLPIRMAPKLTKGHFMLKGSSKMSVNKAAQVLSHTAAAGICTYSALGKLPVEAVHTAEFVDMIDGLFDSFNSRHMKDPKKLKRPISNNSAHESFFQTCLPVLQSLEVLGSQNALFIEGWKLAISCVWQLWHDLKESASLRFLPTSRLNQDTVENLFSTICRKSGFRGNPSPKEFSCALRMVMVAELLKPALNASCPPDNDQFMVTLQTLTNNT